MRVSGIILKATLHCAAFSIMLISFLINYTNGICLVSEAKYKMIKQILQPSISFLCRYVPLGLHEEIHVKQQHFHVDIIYTEGSSLSTLIQQYEYQIYLSIIHLDVI